MRQPYVPIEFSGVEIVLECQAKSLVTVRHMFIISPHCTMRDIRATGAAAPPLPGEPPQNPSTS
jgi:hypothetical protein